MSKTDDNLLEDQIPAAELRDLYVRGTLRQRYSIARQRLDHPHHGPNQVVTAVAALEGFARAIAVKALVRKGVGLEDAYGQVRNEKPIQLIVDHALPALSASVDDFDQQEWDLLPDAVEFRNLLVHEATYLHGGTCDRLIASAVHVFERLAELAGVRQ